MAASPKTEPSPVIQTDQHLPSDAVPQRHLRVALFSDSLLPLANGVSVSIDCLVKELRARGHEVDLYGPTYPGHTDPPEAHTTRFNSIKLPWADGYPIAVPPAYPFLKKFQKRNYDLVHTHTIGIAGYIGRKWAFAHEIPLVASYHTLYDRYAHYCTILPRRYVRYKIARHTQLFYSQADAVVTPTESARRWLDRHRIGQPIHVIPTGIPTPDRISREIARQSLGLKPKDQVLLTVGRLVEEKNLETLVRATAKTIRSLGPHAQHWLVGGGPFRAEIADIARSEGVESQIKLIGSVKPTHLSPYYSAADLFVFASVTETQGLVVQEAMSYGLPAVLIEGGGASYAVEPFVTGFLAKNSVDDLAAVIAEALSDPERLVRIGSNARLAIQQSGPAQMADAMLQVYESVLSRKCVSTSASV